MTEFVFDEAPGPHVHAFLIATGAYRAAQAPDSSIVLNPLPGVVRSALDFADFLVERSQKLFRPLGSIELLVSDPAGPVTWRGQAVDEPKMANIDAPLKRWQKRLDLDEKSLALFYAGGHGCYDAGIHYFAEESGSLGDPLAHTIRLDGFQSGMSTQRCAFQWFIFDCCQDLPDTVARKLYPTTGTTLLGTDADQVREVGQLRIEAASPGRKAFSGAKTHLMEALDAALRNDAAGPIQGGWGARPSLLVEAMNRYGRKRFGTEWSPCAVQSNADRLDCLHRLDGPPRVDVTIRTEPRVAFPDAALKLIDWKTQAVARDVDDNPCEWPPENAASRTATLYGGFYQASAHFDAGIAFRDRDGELFQPVPPSFDLALAIEEREGP